MEAALTVGRSPRLACRAETGQNRAMKAYGCSSEYDTAAFQPRPDVLASRSLLGGLVFSRRYRSLPYLQGLASPLAPRLLMPLGAGPLIYW